MTTDNKQSETHIEALSDLRIGVEMDRHNLPDADAKLAALDAALAVLRGAGEPIRLSKGVQEYLQEGIENATQCEDADIDYAFADELAKLLGPIYAEPQASAEPDLRGMNPIGLTPPQKELQRRQYQRDAEARNAALEEAAAIDSSFGAPDMAAALAEDSAKGAGDVEFPKMPEPAARTSAFSTNSQVVPYYTYGQMMAYAHTAVLADRQQRAGDVKPWIDLFWGVAKELNCLPSLFVDDNEHVLRAAREARAALSAQEGKHDCWCETCRPNTFGNMRMIVCQNCGNKRCPHATDHRNACTGSNEPGQPGSSYEDVRPCNPSGAQEDKQ